MFSKKIYFALGDSMTCEHITVRANANIPESSIFTSEGPSARYYTISITRSALESSYVSVLRVGVLSDLLLIAIYFNNMSKPRGRWTNRA